MTQILTIANQKGGVGKTTTAVNLAYALAKFHQKNVLLIDMDAQGNATTSMGLDKNALAFTMADVLLGECSISAAMQPMDELGAALQVIGANKQLIGLDVMLASVDNAPLILNELLAPIVAKRQFDYIVIDCAPSLSLSTVNALLATTGVIVPMQCEYYALEGVADLFETIEMLKSTNPNLHVQGVVRTLFDGRSTLAQDVSAQLLAYFGETLYQTTIPKNVRLAEAPSFGKTIFAHDNSSKGAQAYQKLAAEVVAQQQGRLL